MYQFRCGRPAWPRLRAEAHSHRRGVTSSKDYTFRLFFFEEDPTTLVQELVKDD